MNTLSLPELANIERLMHELARSSNVALSQAGSELRLRVQRMGKDTDRVYIRWSRLRRFIRVNQVAEIIHAGDESLEAINRRVTELNSQHKAARLLKMAKIAARLSAADAA